MLVKLEAYHDGEAWCARGIGEDIFTQGDTLDDLMVNIKEATSLHLEDSLSDGENLHILVISELQVSGVPPASPR